MKFLLLPRHEQFYRRGEWSFFSEPPAGLKVGSLAAAPRFKVLTGN